ncbi:MAG: hypothetical protein ABIT01_00405 [Thermoanaerobaculia bacterium]
MKINPLLAASALVYALAGITLTFAPQEVTSALGGAATAIGSWFAQLLGASLLGLGSMNWVQRYATVGGVLGRPVLLMNLLFLIVAFFASVDAARHHTAPGALAAAVVLGALLIPFGYRFFAKPPCAT